MRRLPAILCVCLSIYCMAGATVTALADPSPLPHIRLSAKGPWFETDRGEPFVPLGVSYYRPGTGWAPQVWKQFDAAATAADFAKLAALHANCVRVFLSYGSFYTHPGSLDADGVAKLDQFLSLAEKAGLYVHLTGPDAWEGMPAWVAGHDRFADETILAQLEQFWKLLAAHCAKRNVVLAYDLANEPEVGWDNGAMRERWNAWVKALHGSMAEAAKAWKLKAVPVEAPVPAAKNAEMDPLLLEYQQFRESLADEWTRRQAEAIKSVDPEALVTVGNIQWAVPIAVGSPNRYAGFRPERQAKYLDFMEFHFYPLAHGPLNCADQKQFAVNLAYAKILAREFSRPGKAVVLAEMGWSGGGRFPESDILNSEQDQARWCEALVRATASNTTGWLNWGLRDQPEATDVSARTGLFTADGVEKAWGRQFAALAEEFWKHPAGGVVKGADNRDASFPWDRAITDVRVADRFLDDATR